MKKLIVFFFVILRKRLKLINTPSRMSGSSATLKKLQKNLKGNTIT